MTDEITQECPICALKLKREQTGYRCVRCHAHYSGTFMRHLRKTHLRMKIDEHFGEPRRTEATQGAQDKSIVLEEDRTTITTDDRHDVRRILHETKESVQISKAHLERLLEHAGSAAQARRTAQCDASSSASRGLLLEKVIPKTAERRTRQQISVINSLQRNALRKKNSTKKIKRARRKITTPKQQRKTQKKRKQKR